MYRAFAIWRSKTRVCLLVLVSEGRSLTVICPQSLPAVHFHASNVRAWFWKVWRDAMPRALQAKQAREIDKKTVLGKNQQTVG
jgi:protein SFI1